MTPHCSFPVRILPGLILGAVVALTASAIARQDARGSAATMDFIAVTADGQPILDLKPEDVTLRIAGKVRRITSLRLVQIPGLPAGTGATAVTEAPPPPFGTNAARDLGRAIVVVIDDESVPIGREPALRAALGQLLTQLSPRDRVALVTVPHGGIKTDLTTDHDAVGRAIRELSGASVDRAQIAGVADSEDRACKTRDTLQALTSTLDNLRGGQPATVLFLSTSLVGPSGMQMVQRGAAAPNMGVCQLRQEDFRKVGVAAAGARAQFYVIHPDFSAEVARAGIESLRGVTGGPMFHMATTGEAGLTRAARETSAYYSATFEIQGAERPGSTHEVSVRVSRPNVTVRHRPDILLAPATPAGPGGTDRWSPREIVRTTRFFGDLGMRVTAFTSRNAGAGTLKLVGLFEAAEPGVTLTSAAAALFNESGQIVADWSATSNDLSGRAIAFALAPPKAGHYRLRVAAVDGAGRRGAVDYETDVELTRAGALALSSLALGSMRETGFTPKLQFTTESVAVGFLEVYGGTRGGKVSVVFEVAQTINGEPLLQVPVAATATNESDRTIITGSIAIGALPPGDYVVRAIVQADGQPAARVIRTLHKTGK